MEAVLRSINLWKCVECYTCAEYCPNKYDQMTILRVAKHLAIERGLAPAPITRRHQGVPREGAADGGLRGAAQAPRTAGRAGRAGGGTAQAAGKCEPKTSQTEEEQE